MKIVIRKSGNALTQPKKKQQGNVNDKRMGAWGRVTACNSSANTADVVLDTGTPLNDVPVASREWVIYDTESDKGHNTGERDLPPENARVFVVMPNHTFSGCFIAPFSGFSTIDTSGQPFFDEGRESVKERITPSGWHIESCNESGSFKAHSPENEISMEMDLEGENVTLNIFDTELVIEPGKVLLKPKETIIKVDGNMTMEAQGDVDIKGANVTVEAAQAKITGGMLQGMLQVEGNALPTGSGPFCGLPSCLFTGAPHVGDTVMGT